MCIRDRSNGYRVFTDFHIWQCKLIRLAFQVEVLQNGLRKKIVRMVTVSAAGECDTAIILTEEYLKQLRQERRNAEDVYKRQLHFYTKTTMGNPG